MAAPQVTIVTPEAFTITEAARRLGFRHRSTVYDLIRRGELVACQLGGGSLRVPADAITAYLQAALEESPSPTNLWLRPRRRGATIERRGRPAAT